MLLKTLAKQNLRRVFLTKHGKDNDNQTNFYPCINLFVKFKQHKLHDIPIFKIKNDRLLPEKAFDS